MYYCIASATDIGTTRNVNQDRLWAASYSLGKENLAFAVLCDGMGGLQYGEVASELTVAAFEEWARLRLPELELPLSDHVLRDEWTKLVLAANQSVKAYGEEHNCVLGTTLTALLLTESRYSIINIGDSRAYALDTQARQLTVDHTVIEDQVSRGMITPEQAHASPMQSVLTRCIGVRDTVFPDLFFGDTIPGVVYLLCSDGFRHRLVPEELCTELLSGAKGGTDAIRQRLLALIELCKQRGERDNISAVAIFVRREK